MDVQKEEGAGRQEKMKKEEGAGRQETKKKTLLRVAPRNA